MRATAYESWTNGDQVGIHCSGGKNCLSRNAGVLLKFLRYSASQTIRVAWDMDGFIAPVLRLLPPDTLDRLSRFDGDLTYEGHELYYLPDRMFRVGKSRFYGIRAFWGGLSGEDPELDAVQERAIQLLDTLAEIGLPNPRKLTSPIAVFEDSDWGKSVYAGIPKGHDLPEDWLEVLEYAAKADGKDWVSNHVVGHFDRDEIFDYDIAACYPSLAAQLPHLGDLAFWKTRKLGERELSAALGVVRGRFFLDPDAEYAHCSPIIGPVGDLPGNPMGDIPEDFYTLDEVRFVLENELGTFTMHSGWFGTPDTPRCPYTPRYPLRGIMTTLYGKRAISPMADPTVKGIANSLIGKLIETRVSGEYGPLRNDLYHALITAGARVKVARFLIDNQVRPDELICIQTDGVKLTRDIPLPPNGMGSWVNKGSAATILLSPYKVYAADARPYRLTYSDVLSMIGEHPQSQRYLKTVEHRLTLVQAIRQHEDATRVGEVIEIPDSLDLVALEIEQNRVYKKLPRTGRGLLEGKYPSAPFIY